MTKTDRLTNPERDTLNAQLERDGFAVLPRKLPADLMDAVLGAIDRLAAEQRRENSTIKSVKMHNCVEMDAAFRALMMYEPALQLCYDAFGPMFHLNQSNFISRVREDDQEAAKKDFAASIDWHADGPRPRNFPRVNGAMGLHYLKFGYFLTDLTHGTGGSLEVVRGSHKRDELDGKGRAFNIQDYVGDLVRFDVEAGSVVAFHQALWHAAYPNQSDIERKNVYISYCPTWMRPVDRDFPAEADLEGLTPEERWLLGEPRSNPLRWWLPREDDAERMARFARDSESESMMDTKPNIIFVFPDQLSHRWAESDIVHTPNLDQFKSEATRFTQAYSTSPVCTPYRACLLTGQYPSQTGVRWNGMALPPDTRTIAHYLNEAGYATHYIGKWHLSGDPQENRWVPPDKRGGFQHFIGWESHHVDHLDGLIWRDDPDEAIHMTGHETDGLTDIVLAEMAQGFESPFCLFVSYQSPHPPCSPPADYRNLYAGADLMPEPNVDSAAYYHRPEWQADYDLQAFRERYYGEITQIDAAFGRLLQAIDDNTIIIFTSDHGEMNGAHGLFGKGVMYDEAIHVPLYIRMPGQANGRDCTTPVATIDFLPTLLELAGVTPPDTPGRSFADLLYGRSLPARPVFSEYDDYLCVTNEGWKLVVRRDDLQPLLLFNTENDPYELNNRLDSSDRLSRLQTLVEAFAQAINIASGERH